MDDQLGHPQGSGQYRPTCQGLQGVAWILLALLVGGLGWLGFRKVQARQARLRLDRAWALCPPRPATEGPPPPAQASFPDLQSPGFQRKDPTRLTISPEDLGDLKLDDLVVDYPFRVPGFPPFTLRFGHADLFSRPNDHPLRRHRSLHFVDPSGRSTLLVNGIGLPEAHPSADIGGIGALVEPLPEDPQRKAIWLFWSGTDVNFFWFQHIVLVLYDPTTRSLAFLHGSGCHSFSHITFQKGSWRIRMPQIPPDREWGWNPSLELPRRLNQINEKNFCRVSYASLQNGAWKLVDGHTCYVVHFHKEGDSHEQALDAAVRGAAWDVSSCNPLGGVAVSATSGHWLRDFVEPEQGKQLPFKWNRQVWLLERGELEKKPITSARACALVRSGEWKALLHEADAFEQENPDLEASEFRVQLLVRVRWGRFSKEIEKPRIRMLPEEAGE